ncbi:MAG: hypothetical protein A3F16_08295 [Deltaproteobacteria bacterium RIFCSPHIGHO2_12_FULL_43_9]|nr:MAG: hypothetical protein A3F16_08295 [Deltaproteobacteria bacterium RIFCSPHIGHO2_12_FULL_43_9]
MSRSSIFILVSASILFLKSCTKARRLEEKRLEPTYPHSEEFKTTNMHGLQFLSDSNGCKSCHGKNLLGVSSAPSCQKCHKDFPHSKEFKTTTHGEIFLTDQNSCKTCHGKDLMGGGPRISCQQCHNNFPHSEEFKTTTHGETFFADSNSCRTCHGKDLMGGGPRISCQQCHKNFPHSEEFKTTTHGQIFFSDSSSCKTCHGQDLMGGGNRVSCQKCHKNFPHPKEFKSTFIHGTEFLKERNQCAQCHGFNYDGGGAKVACATCHSYPHGDAWALAKNHGAGYLKSAEKKGNSGAFLLNCLACHGEESKFKERHSKDFVSCKTCHVQIPHTEELKFGMGHEGFARSYKGKCLICHAEESKDGKPSFRLFPEIGEEGCYFCHDKGSKIRFHWGQSK